VALSVVASFANAAPRATVTAALVSDIGKFNDRGFNQNQLLGLNKAKSALGVKTIALQ
jgi:basic membrane lipoprotein Med (substrate-binding protein (PBP1-ABC) superfamily)